MIDISTSLTPSGKSEIRISKSETISKSQIHRFKTAGAFGPPHDRLGFEFGALVI
jgi:hypothetical protein